jgi:RecA/RadA recombinase
MKNNRFTHESTLTPANISVVHTARPDIIVSSGIPELDGLCGGFKAGELTVVDGNSGRISDLPNQLCVNTYRTFQSETIYIDGGICANPYRIAQYARMHELNQQDVLQNVVISRAFTVYQLSTIIQELLEPMTQKRNPRTLIVGMLPVLYLDSEISTREAQTLLSQDLEKLQQLTTKYNLITVCTNLDVMPLASSKGIGKTLYDYANEIVRMKQFEQCTALELVKQGKHATIIHGAAGQLRLEAFGMVS